MATEIPDDLIEELIRGAYEPELPDELLLVSRVLRAARGPIPGEDRARETEVIEAMIAAMRVTPIAAALLTPRCAARSGNASRGRRRALVAITAAVSVLGVGGVAAAAGSLPTPIQSLVHDSLSHLGVSVPSTETKPPTPADPAPSHAADTAPTPQHPGDAPGHSGEAPGHSGGAPGQSGDAAGRSGDAPGKSGEAPSHAGDAVGQPDDAPGHSGDAPGHGGDAAGRSGDVPGQSKHDTETDDEEPEAGNDKK